MNDLRTTDLLSIDPFEDAFRNFMVAWVARTNGNGNARSPQIEIDLSEANGNYKIKANIPGVSKDDIDVKVDDNNFTTSAEVKKESEEKMDRRVLHSERH
jgi:HSP20 family protein